MRMRKKWWAIPTLYDSGICHFWPEKNKGKWPEIFKNENDIHLDIGCGSGDFSLAMANIHKNTNFILWDRESDVLVYTLSNLRELNVKNAVFVARDIDCLLDSFDEGEISSITVHFPNPWPKNRHNKRRLTYPTMLEKYKKILKNGGIVDFRTDDTELYYDTLSYIDEVGGIILSHYEDTIKTEPLSHYESRFRARGVKIKSIRFKFN